MRQLSLLIWNDKKDVLIAVAAGMISGVTAVALFAQSGLLISTAALMPPFYVILILTVFLKLFGVSKSASKYVERLISHRVTFTLMSKVRMLFFKRLIPQAHLLNTYKSGELLTRITSDVEVLQHYFLRVLYPPLVASLVFITTILFLLFFSPWLALVMLIGFLLTSIIIPSLLVQVQVKTAIKEKQIMTYEATEYFYGYRELQLHQQVNARKELLLRLDGAYTVTKRKELDHEQRGYVWNLLAAQITTFTVIAVGAYLTSVGELKGVFLAMLILVALTTFESAVPLAMLPTFLRHTKEALTRLEEVAPEEEISNAPTVQLNDHAPTLSFENVTYQYPKTFRPAVVDINLHISAKEKIAIVGSSGSGKTTLGQLIMKEIMPLEGALIIDGHDTSTIQEASIYDHLGVMLQHNHFFSGTIQSNLQFAKDDATDSEMITVLKKAQLNKKLDDVVYEKGVNLSGGEKQRLAFARLLLRKSTLWILDEPFTSIDVQTENQLFLTLLQEAKDKTLILITHRLSKLQHLDKIYVMDHGKIVESGSHKSLIQQQGYYYEMYKKYLN